MRADSTDYSELSTLFINGTLKKSPTTSNTEGLLRASQQLMEKLGVRTEVLRTVDYQVAPGVQPDMTKHGWLVDDWPVLYEKVRAADILVVCGPIWLGDNSSQTRLLIERLYGNSTDTNVQGQYIYYGKVGGCIITGNEDGAKHCAMNVLYSLQHIGYTIPPQADAAWLGAVGPGPSYLDEGSGGPENDFTNRNITFMTHNLLHMAKLLKAQGGIPAEGNVPSEWQNGNHFGYSSPEHN